MHAALPYLCPSNYPTLATPLRQLHYGALFYKPGVWHNLSTRSVTLCGAILFYPECNIMFPCNQAIYITWHNFLFTRNVTFHNYIT